MSMGVRGSFTEITPDIFEQMVRGEEPKIPEGKWHSIDKDWFDFHSIFSKKGYPLNLVITGDHLHPQSQQTLDAFCAGGYDWYFGLASPQLVDEADKALQELSIAELKIWYDDQECGGYDCSFYFLAELKSAYASAAEHGNALMIMVC